MQNYRDWGATAAGQSPWSVTRKECIHSVKKKKNVRYFPNRFATNNSPLTTERAASVMHGESGA